MFQEQRELMVHVIERAKNIHPQTASKSVLHHYTLQLHPQQTSPSVPQCYLLQLHTNSLLLLACYHYKDLLLYCILQCRGTSIEISSVDLVASDFRCHDEWDQMISFWICNTRRSWFFYAKKEELFVCWELKKFDYYDQMFDSVVGQALLPLPPLHPLPLQMIQQHLRLFI
ncbi:hypothetical protein AAHE18_19G033400 [Arachis hypogaea]